VKLYYKKSMYHKYFTRLYKIKQVNLASQSIQMKKLYTLAIVLIVTSTAMFAQKDVYFNISHFLGTSNFAFAQQATNNIGNAYEVDRLQYYVSSIALIHDGGQTTPVPNHWILVDASTYTNDLLGNFNITNLEEVTFSIGVESAVNNSDPTLWAVGHPLALSTPSMHWGWAGGYRFVAFEGRTGTTFSDTYQIHATGNQNYFSQTITTTGEDDGNEINIYLDADYQRGLEDIIVSSALINHGDMNEAVDLLQNFQTFVFKAGVAPPPNGIVNNPLENLAFYPNPVANNETITIENGEISNIVISDLAGKVIRELEVINGQITVDLAGGSYLAIAYNKNEQIAVAKIMVTQ